MISGKIYAALTGAAVVAGTLMASAQVPADAQVVRIPQAAPDQMLPVHEVVGIVRSTGLDPLGAPIRYGVTYRLRAIDRAGRDLNVVVDARFGDILLVERAGGPYPLGGQYPERRIATMPPGDDDPEMYDRRPETSPRVPPYPARVMKPAPTPRVATVPADKRPPMPRPKPENAAGQTVPSATPAAAMPAVTPPAPKPETAPAEDAPTKWKDEPAATNAPAAAPSATPKGPDVTPLE